MARPKRPGHAAPIRALILGVAADPDLRETKPAGARPRGCHPGTAGAAPCRRRRSPPRAGSTRGSARGRCSSPSSSATTSGTNRRMPPRPRRARRREARRCRLRSAAARSRSRPAPPRRAARSWRGDPRTGFPRPNATGTCWIRRLSGVERDEAEQRRLVAWVTQQRDQRRTRRPTRPDGDRDRRGYGSCTAATAPRAPRGSREEWVSSASAREHRPTDDVSARRIVPGAREIQERGPGQGGQQHVLARLLGVPDHERAERHQRGGDEARGSARDQLAAAQVGDQDDRDSPARPTGTAARLAGPEHARPQPSRA